MLELSRKGKIKQCFLKGGLIGENMWYELESVCYQHDWCFFYISCISSLQIIWASHVINIIICRDRSQQRAQISLPWHIICHGLGASSANQCTISVCILLLPHLWHDLQQQQHLLKQSLLSCIAWQLQQCASCDRNAFNKAPPSNSPPKPQHVQQSMFSSVVCLFCLIRDWENKSHSFTNPLNLSP